LIHFYLVRLSKTIENRLKTRRNREEGGGWPTGKRKYAPRKRRFRGSSRHIPLRGNRKKTKNFKSAILEHKADLQRVLLTLPWGAEGAAEGSRPVKKDNNLIRKEGRTGGGEELRGAASLKRRDNLREKGEYGSVAESSPKKTGKGG